MAGTIQSIERAAAVLHVLGANAEPLALGELARLVDLPKPTLHGIVRTLCAVGYVAQEADSGRYRLAPGLATVGQALDPYLLRSRALNWADGVAARTGLEVQLGVLRADEVELLHHVFRPDGSPQRLRVGERQPAHATALGHVLLAFAPVAVRPPVTELASYTPATLTDPGALRRVAALTRRRGWACAVGTLTPGVAAVAAPVLHRGGFGVGALAVVGPTEQVAYVDGRPRRHLEEQVVTAARSISATLQERL